jgi:hypothetical protein
MKTKEGFVLRPLGREFILVAENVKEVNFNKMISLNESAAYLWSGVEGKDFDADTLTALLLDKYDVDEATARADSEAIIAKWLDAGIIEE